MIPEEYPMPPQRRRGDKGHVWQDGCGVLHACRPWLWRLGGFLVLAAVGVVCTQIIDSSGLRARVLAGIASACSDDVGAYSLLRERHGASAKSRSSVAVCAELVRIESQDAQAHVMLGNAYVEAGQTGEAMACYHRALALDPNCFEAYLGMGKTHFNCGSYSEAIVSYRKALTIRPRSADAKLSLGLALSNAGKYEEAMQAFQKAKELDATIVQTQVMTGNACLEAGMCAGHRMLQRGRAGGSGARPSLLQSRPGVSARRGQGVGDGATADFAGSRFPPGRPTGGTDQPVKGA